MPAAGAGLPAGGCVVEVRAGFAFGFGYVCVRIARDCSVRCFGRTVPLRRLRGVGGVGRPRRVASCVDARDLARAILEIYTQCPVTGVWACTVNPYAASMHGGVC